MKRQLIAIAAVLVSLTASAQCCKQSCGSGCALTAGSYNLRYYNDNKDSQTHDHWNTRRQAVVDLLRFHCYDIFGTQEGQTLQLDFIKQGLPHFDYIGVGRNDGKAEGERAAIFFDTRKFECMAHGDFWLSETPETPSFGWDGKSNKRICTWGKFRCRSGFEFYYFNTHFALTEIAIREGAKLLRSRIEKIAGDQPVILTGDFNSFQGSEAYKIITAGGLLRDSYEIADFTYAPTGTFHGFNPATFSYMRIDHVFVSRHFQPDVYGVLTDTYRIDPATGEPLTAKGCHEMKGDEMRPAEIHAPSDHYPLLVKLHTEKQ